MSTRRCLPAWRYGFGLFFSFLIGSVLQAASDPISIREVYWQELPRVSWVYVDNLGRPWCCTRQADLTPSAGNKIGQLHQDQVLLLGDRKGRLWINTRYGTPHSTRLFDNAGWHETGISASSAFEDSAGRVFLADRTHVHVLDGDTWSKQFAYEEPSGAKGHFAEDPQGRVWFWAEKFDRPYEPHYPGTCGALSYDHGKWSSHNRGTGMPTDDIGMLLPLADDRFLLVAPLEGKQHGFTVWSPSREPNAEDRKIYDVIPPTGSYYDGVDLDGCYHFRCQKRANVWKYALIPPRGEARLLSPAEAERLRQLPRGRYENGSRIFGRMDEVPHAIPGALREAICRDREGRIYFRAGNGVNVLWPKCERPGDVIHWRADPRGVQPLFQTADGVVWGRSGEEENQALVRWEDGRWTDTPVKPMPHPPWGARMAAPWKASSPLYLPGRDNTVLAVVMRDIYQDLQAEHKDLDHWSIMRMAPPKTGERKWPEAWLYSGGKWSGPAKLPALFAKHGRALAAAYSEPAREAAWFALQGDGQGRLWVAYDTRVLAVDGDDVKEWACPDAAGDPATWFSLCRLPDGRMLLVQFSAQPKGVANSLRALSFKDGKILAEDFPEPPGFAASYGSAPPTAFVARDKSLWLTRFPRPTQVWRFHLGQWEPRKDLAQLLYEEADGSLWFTPAWTGKAPSPEERGYRVVKGERTSVFKCPVDWRLTPTRDGRLLAACGYWFLELGKSQEPLQRNVARLQISDRLLNVGPTFLGNDGTIFVDGYLGR